MSLFSAFAWFTGRSAVEDDARSQRNTTITQTSRSAEWISSAPPCVLASNSSSDESFITAANSFHYPLTSPDSSTSSASHPSTPVGLKPRPSIEMIYDELGLTQTFAVQVGAFEGTLPSEGPAQSVEAVMENGDVLVQSNDEFQMPIGVLPPRICQSSSWGTAQSHSIQSQSQESSSLSGLYRHNFSSWSSSQQFSFSQEPFPNMPPTLETNQTSTAVGATVAALAQKRHEPVIQAQNFDFNRYVNQKQSSDKVHSEGYASIQVPCNQKAFFSDDRNSVEGSPSSRAARLLHSTDQNANNISFNSASNTVRVSHNSWDLPLDNLAKHNTHDESCHHSFNEVMQFSQTGRAVTENMRIEHFSGYNTISNPWSFDAVQNPEYQLDGNILGLKARNQQRAKEELLFSSIERLQDDPDLLNEVVALDGMSFEYDKPVESILQGFSLKKRQRILKTIDCLLCELSNGVAVEEFFLGCSDEIDEYDSTDNHKHLRDALTFCKTVIQTSVPTSERTNVSKSFGEKGRWTILSELRSAVGIKLSTPSYSRQKDYRGDSTVFSLPYSPDTPMTSNVSIATTLTSTIATYRSSNDAPKINETNGLELRRTIAMMSYILNKLSTLLIALSFPENGNRSASSRTQAADELKGCYFELLQMDRNELRSLIDAFEFSYEDKGQDYNAPMLLSLPTLPNAPSAIINDPIANRSIGNTVAPRRQRNPTRSNRFARTAYNDENSNPTSGRIPVIGYQFEVDDLRRHSGSCDYDECVDVREDCEEQHAHRAATGKKTYVNANHGKPTKKWKLQRK